MKQEKTETCPHCGAQVALSEVSGRRGMLKAHKAEPFSVTCEGSWGMSLELEALMMRNSSAALAKVTRADADLCAQERARRFR